jgi:hypothetical protein
MPSVDSANRHQGQDTTSCDCSPIESTANHQTVATSWTIRGAFTKHSEQHLQLGGRVQRPQFGQSAGLYFGPSRLMVCIIRPGHEGPIRLIAARIYNAKAAPPHVYFDFAHHIPPANGHRARERVLSCG